MSRCGDIYENKVTGERAVVLRGDQDAQGQSGLVQLTVQPRRVVVGEHVHPSSGSAHHWWNAGEDWRPPGWRHRKAPCGR